MNQLFKALVLCLLFAGCSKKVTDADFKKIKIGMTEAEVIQILGKPEEVFQPRQYKEFKLKNFEYGNENRIVLEKGKVNAVVVDTQVILSADEDRTPPKDE